MRKQCLILLALTLALSTCAFANVLIYTQPPTFDGVFYASQNDTGGFGNFATVYDNFTIFSKTTKFRVDDVEWYGGYFGGGKTNHITAWTVSFYADAANSPGALLWSRSFSASFPGYTEACAFPNNTCGYDIDNIRYGPVVLPNTQYWLSVVPDLKFPPQWGWATGVMGDGLAYQTFFGTTSALGRDFAFNVQGVTPEPGTMVMLGMGLLAAAASLRHKFKL